MIMNVQTLVAYYILDLLDSDDLSNIAVELMNDGIESPSLILLAGIEKQDVVESNKLFEKALSELNIDIPTPNEAAIFVCKDYCNQILSEEITPYMGAEKITKNIFYRFKDIKGLSAFAGLVSEYDDFGEIPQINYYGESHCKEHRLDILNSIKLEAQRYLSSSTNT